MYAVIFRAQVAELDDEYGQMAERLRTLALERYGCTEFVSMTEGDREMALSYWPSLEHIKAWRHDAEHLVAQELGRTKWYRSYSVQVVELLREYASEAATLP